MSRDRATATLCDMATAYDPDDKILHARSPEVPWADWTDGKMWQLVRGVDFDQTPRQARAAGYKWASRHGFWCSGTIDLDNPDVLWIRFEAKGE